MLKNLLAKVEKKISEGSNIDKFRNFYMLLTQISWYTNNMTTHLYNNLAKDNNQLLIIFVDYFVLLYMFTSFLHFILIP